jgi:monoamine oxidase
VGVARPAGSTEVLVLGAGLAGLAAALALQDQGLRVRVIEAAAAVGGRIRTLDDLPGRPETGGTQIADAYHRTLALARRLGLAIEPNARSPLLRDERLVLQVAGRRRTLAQWAGADDNPMPEAYRELPPDRALLRWIGPSPVVLPASAAAASAASATAAAAGPEGPADWRTVPFADRSAEAALRERGASAAALRLLELHNPYGDTLADTSLLNLYYAKASIDAIVKVGGPVRSVVGGNQRLPEAMAAALKGELLLRRRVQAIETQAARAGAQIHTTDGQRHEARFVVCTLPPPALARLRVEPALPPLVAEGLARVPMSRITQLHLEVLRPFWEDVRQADGTTIALSPFLWTDGPLERVFPQDRAGDGRPATLTVWINGAGCASWDALDEDGAARRAEDELAKILPGARGAVRLARRVAWHREPNFGGGWANWLPGQLGSEAAKLVRPHGSVHFAGEHTSHGLRGIEAAVESGQRAAREVLARL